MFGFSIRFVAIKGVANLQPNIHVRFGAKRLKE